MNMNFMCVCLQTNVWKLWRKKHEDNKNLKKKDHKDHPGTIIITDCWKAYNELDQENYKHLAVNTVLIL